MKMEITTYCVRETQKLELVADLLARTTEKLKQLVAYLKEEYPNRENVKRLAEKFNQEKISETLPTSKYTAYSENKGEKLASIICSYNYKRRLKTNWMKIPKNY